MPYLPFARTIADLEGSAVGLMPAAKVTAFLPELFGISLRSRISPPMSER